MKIHKTVSVHSIEDQDFEMKDGIVYTVNVSVFGSYWGGGKGNAYFSEKFKLNDRHGVNNLLGMVESISFKFGDFMNASIEWLQIEWHDLAAYGFEFHFDDAENIPEEIKTYFYTGDSPEDYLSDCNYD